ncbi:hypothetical protein DIPPA_27905 [Diplonema papillatum]|nr:hypothetical protein DIPPA_27905 [Diplonema papillatum]
MRKQVIANVTSDILCPWCWVGKRSLEAAAAQVVDTVALEVRWHPAFLNKDVPAEGVDKLQHYTARFGKQRAKVLLTDKSSQVQVAGSAFGIEFNWKPGTILSQSMDGHRLLWHVLDTRGAAVQNELMERLFHMYFTENRDVGNADVLVAATEGLGLDEAAVRLFLKSGEYVDAVNAKHQENQTKVKSVPHFAFSLADADAPAAATTGGQDVPTFKSVLLSL